MSGSDMKGTWARKGYTFQFTRDTEWEGHAVPTIQYRSPFTKKSDRYQFAQVFFVIIPQRLKWKICFVCDQKEGLKPGSLSLGRWN